MALICSTVFLCDSANKAMSSSSVGTNSCRGGSKKRIVTGYPLQALNNPSKSFCCIGKILSSAFSLSSKVSAQIISLKAAIRSASKNICSVRHKPIPCAPNSMALAASFGVSALVRTFIVRYSSAHAIIRPNSPPIVASTVGMIPS